METKDEGICLMILLIRVQLNRFITKVDYVELNSSNRTFRLQVTWCQPTVELTAAPMCERGVYLYMYFYSSMKGSK